MSVASAELRSELFDEPGLADAGLTDNHRQVPIGCPSDVNKRDYRPRSGCL
jgi:hypothetical protein